MTRFEINLARAMHVLGYNVPTIAREIRRARVTIRRLVEGVTHRRKAWPTREQAVEFWKSWEMLKGN